MLNWLKLNRSKLNISKCCSIWKKFWDLRFLKVDSKVNALVDWINNQCWHTSSSPYLPSTWTTRLMENVQLSKMDLHLMKRMCHVLVYENLCVSGGLRFCKTNYSFIQHTCRSLVVALESKLLAHTPRTAIILQNSKLIASSIIDWWWYCTSIP